MTIANSSTGPSMTGGSGEDQGGYEGPQVAYRVRPKIARVDKPVDKPDKPEKLQRLIRYLLSAGDQKFTGYIKVNFSQGAIGRIERFEEILSK